MANSIESVEVYLVSSRNAFALVRLLIAAVVLVGLVHFMVLIVKLLFVGTHFHSGSSFTMF
jgi:hypothetical protein